MGLLGGNLGNFPILKPNLATPILSRRPPNVLSSAVGHQSPCRCLPSSVSVSATVHRWLGVSVILCDWESVPVSPGRPVDHPTFSQAQSVTSHLAGVCHPLSLSLRRYVDGSVRLPSSATANPSLSRSVSLPGPPPLSVIYSRHRHHTVDGLLVCLHVSVSGRFSPSPSLPLRSSAESGMFRYFD